MNILSSYCGLTDSRIRASEKDLPVPILMYLTNEISYTDSCNTTQKCLAIKYCPKLYDEKVALQKAGSIITVTAGDPDKEEELKYKLKSQRCQEDDYFCCEHTSKTDQKPKYGNLMQFLLNH